MRPFWSMFAVGAADWVGLLIFLIVIIWQVVAQIWSAASKKESKEAAPAPRRGRLDPASPRPPADARTEGDSWEDLFEALGKRVEELQKPAPAEPVRRAQPPAVPIMPAAPAPPQAPPPVPIETVRPRQERRAVVSATLGTLEAALMRKAAALGGTPAAAPPVLTKKLGLVTREDLRRAVVLKEILDPPLALRSGSSTGWSFPT